MARRPPRQADRGDVPGATPNSVSAGTWAVSLPGGAQVRAGCRADGDFADPSRPGASEARRLLADVPWTWLRQVHGADVVVVMAPGEGRAQPADGAVTNCPGAALAVLTADCAPVALSSPEGVVGVAHAGWRGLMAGVVGATVAAMKGLGAGEVFAALGPCVHPHAYRFSPGDLERVVQRFGPGVATEDDDGYPALDLPAAVAAALGDAGAALVADAKTCTHCSPDHWSWRARGDMARQAMVVWMPVGAP